MYAQHAGTPQTTAGDFCKKNIEICETESIVYMN